VRAETFGSKELVSISANLSARESVRLLGGVIGALAAPH
jgi:hypothetical protein